jgi:cytochrome c peroxidase
MKNGIIVLMAFVFFSSCKREKDPILDDRYTLNIPVGFPQPDIPTDNFLTKSRVELGKKLFFDPRISVDNTISCASCHLPQNAFSDPRALSTGVQGRIGFRNSPALFNLAWMPIFMKDGGVPSLELQAHAPISDINEMDADILQVVDELKPFYNAMSQYAYKRDFDSYVITRSLAAFQRSLVSGDSRYDRYLYQGGGLTSSELRGKELFFSDSLHCGDCHGGFNFTTFGFENNGLYLNHPDTGRARITLLPGDVGKFKVASLRNVEVTAPYMHDGSLATLEDVINHYASGGVNHPNKSPLITGFQISQQDKSDLIAFLLTLTDHRFLNNPAHRP